MATHDPERDAEERAADQRAADQRAADELDSHRREPGEREAPPAVAVTVVRSGGFAGIRRQWHVSARAADAATWVGLIDDCPWDDVDPAPSRGADRFAWSLRACVSGAEHSAHLTDDQAHGPWRALIDAVRGAQAPHV